MMSLPGNRTKQNTEIGSPGLTVERRPQQVHGQPGCFAGCLERAHWPGVCKHSRCSLRKPPRGLWPFDRRNRKVTGELQPRPGPLSHPTWVTLSPFPVCVHGGFLGNLCLRQAAADVAHKSVGWVCPHPRGDQAGRDWKSPGSTGCTGRLHALRGVSFVQGGYLSRHMFLLAA